MPAQPTVSNITEAEFEKRKNQLTALIEDWGDRECSSFDDAVRKAAGEPAVGGSIWDVPMIDSKRVVSLLTELEPVLGRKLPPTLIKRGGYASIDDLKADLVPKLKIHAVSGKAKPLSSPTTSQDSAAPPRSAASTLANTNAQV